MESTKSTRNLQMDEETPPESSEKQYKRLLLRQWSDLGTMIIPSE